MSQTTRTALITGASFGIGKALAASFAADGWNLVLAARSVEKMEALAGELGQRHSISVTEGIVPCGPAVAVKLVGVGVVATVTQE